MPYRFKISASLSRKRFLRLSISSNALKSFSIENFISVLTSSRAASASKGSLSLADFGNHNTDCFSKGKNRCHGEPGLLHQWFPYQFLVPTWAVAGMILPLIYPNLSNIFG